MFSKMVEFVIRGMGECFDITKSFILDRVGNVNITYFHFLIFGIFMTIVIRLIGFIKGIQEVEDEKKETYNRKQKEAYNEWLRDHPRKPRRFKK